MSVESLAAVLHHSRAKGTAKLVLIGIANHDGDGGAWVGVRKLATYANVDERNVQRALERLAELGELVIHLQQGGDHRTAEGRRPNRYDVTVSCPPWCDRTTQHRDTRETRQPNLRGLRGGGIATPRHQRHPSNRQGVAPTSPLPPAPASPEPSYQPNPTSVSTQPVTARAMCNVCSRDEVACHDANMRVPKLERHTFEAVRRASG